MSSTTGLFYAYAKHTTTDWAWRYLIVFVDRATADEWWRAVTDSVAAGYTRFNGVQRVSQQFYIHNPDVDGNIMQTINDERCAKAFLGRVFFTLLNDRDGRIIDAAPFFNYTDNISGHGFFIHSSLQGDQYWFYDGEQLVVSRTHRTKFIISMRCQGCAQNQSNCQGHKGTVMIGADSIIISAFGSQTSLGIQSDGQVSLGPSGQAAAIKFSDFDGGFQVTSNDTLVYNSMGGGDRWELV